MNTPDELLRKVLAALASAPRFRTGPDDPLRVVPLGEGEHHRIYRLDVAGRAYTVRLPHPASHRLYDHEIEAGTMRQAARAGVGPAVRAILPELRTVVTDFVPGHALTAQALRDPAIRARAAQTLRRLHDGPMLRGVYRPDDLFHTYDKRMRERKAQAPTDFGRLFVLAQNMFDTLARYPLAPRPCHNDPVPENFIDDGQRLWLIDWEFGGMNDPFFDLATLSIQGRFEADETHALLAAWAGEVTPPAEARLAMMRYLVCFLWLQYNLAEWALDAAQTAYREAVAIWLSACRALIEAGAARGMAILRR